MKKIFAAFLFAYGVLFPLYQILAAGGGGGGGTPTCEQDTWLCTEWSECSAQGVQKRTCNLSFDCPTAETPKPTEAQSCTPPCTEDTWECNEWSECSVDGEQSRTCILKFDCPIVSNVPPLLEKECSPLKKTEPSPTPAPAPEPPKRQNPFVPRIPETQKPKEIKPACAQDRWDCGPWSDECDAFGNQKRTCKMTLDCPEVETLPPQFFKRCEKLQCGDIISIQDRVTCRLNLTPAGLARENELQYLPEECRLVSDDINKQKCINLYRAYRPCWDKPIGEQRSVCAMSILGLGQNVAQAMSQCIQTGKDKEQCKAVHRQKVYELIKFRFYDLEERAEEFIERGANKALVADFVIFITESKDRFNKATTQEERKQIILDVRRGWKEFVQKVKMKMQK